ncbi:MAG TPA: HemK/PrmC family methyltransferase [Candidatus Saccharimonadales bacterium]
MTIGNYLRSSTDQLQRSKVLTYRLDALLLLSHVLGLSKAQILAQPDKQIDQKELKVLNDLVAKRSQHIPIAQLTNSCEFYGRKFIVNEHVMQPRPESEALIDSLKLAIADDGFLFSLTQAKSETSEGQEVPPMLSIADIGTGSGALGITAYLELRNCHVDLFDIDSSALEVAKNNVAFHTININVIQSDLLAMVDSSYHIYLANLPYVPDDMELNKSAEYEPTIAIFGGIDGLDLYRKLFKSLADKQQRPLYILAESFPSDHLLLESIAKGSNYSLQQTNDFIQVFKLNKN